MSLIVLIYILSLYFNLYFRKKPRGNCPSKHNVTCNVHVSSNFLFNNV